jgi:hypothetical protein
MKDRKDSVINNISFNPDGFENSTLLLQSLRFDLSKGEARRFTVLQQLDLSEIAKNTSSDVGVSVKNILPRFQIDNTNIEEFPKERKVVVIKKRNPIRVYQHTNRPLAIVKCQNITTYFIDLYVFSLYTDPVKILHDHNVPSVIVKPGKNGFDSHALLGQVGLQLDKPTIMEFVNNINKMYKSDRIVTLDERFAKRRLLGLFITLSSLALIIALIILCINFNDVFFSTEDMGFWLKLALFIIVLLLLGYFCLKNFLNVFKVLPRNKEYNELSIRVTVYPELEDFLETWNKFIFIPKKLFVTVPPNFEYIHFLLDISNEVKLEHHTVNDLMDY